MTTDQHRDIKKEIEFIEKSRIIHGNLYNYSKVIFISNKVKVTIIDPEYGEFEQIPYNHLMGANSPKRSYLIRGKKKLKTTEEFIKRAREIHGDLYDYSKVVYRGRYSQITIIDPIYGEFVQLPNEHLSGCGCRKRGIDERSQLYSYTTEEFIKRAREIHGDLYDYSKVVYIRSRIKVKIIDPLYGEFMQYPSVHLSGSGSPRRRYKFNSNEKDHIIPLSLLCRSKDRNKMSKKCDLFKLLDSNYNKRIISKEKNREKSDVITLFGEDIKGRNYRKDYELIRYLLLRELNINLYDYKIYYI